MASGAVLVAHLGMTGKFGVMAADAPLHKHDHLVLVLDNGLEVRYNDSRRFGSISVWPAARAAESEAEFSAREGIEPFGPQFTGRELHRLAAGRSAPVKALIMNSRLVAGIGNIYANEMLFAARIDPETPAGALYPAPVEPAGPGRPGHPRPGHRGGRLHGGGLPLRQRPPRLLPAAAQRLRPRRRALPPLQPQRGQECARRPRHLPLPPLPAGRDRRRPGLPPRPSQKTTETS